MAAETRFQGTVEKVAFGGAGVIRQDGLVVFVPGVLAGERIRYRMTSGHRTFAQGELLDVLEPAPGRVPVECPLMLQPRGLGPQPRPFCPGCAYGHADYGRELALKQEQLVEVIGRIGGITGDAFSEPIGSPRPLHYRNKIILHTQKDGRETRLGYLGFDNRTVLDIPFCPLAAPPLEDLLRTLRSKPGFFETLRHNMDVTLRWTEHDGPLYWRGDPDSRDPWLRERTPVGPMRVPRGGFFQVNPWASDLLFEAVRNRIREIRPARIIDLYCGAGFFSLAAASAGVAEGVGLDSESASIAAASENARLHRLGGFAFQAGRAERGLGPLLAAGPARGTLLLVDPPRTGLEPGVVNAIDMARPENLVYVSCAADTLARDAARLSVSGYRAERFQLVDLFSRTAHFETVAWFRLEGA